MEAEESQLAANQQQQLQKLLADWLTAVALFHQQYMALSSLLDKGPGADPLAAQQVWIGQCPVGQLNASLQTMQQQLKQLLLEAEQFDPPPTDRNYDQLLSHTQRLQQLNRQASHLLRLASLPAS